MRWLGGPPDVLCFAREPGFIFAANLGEGPAPLPPHREILLASEPIDGSDLPPGTAAWLSA
jgi:alpha-glucosidase